MIGSANRYKPNKEGIPIININLKDQSKVLEKSSSESDPDSFDSS